MMTLRSLVIVFLIISSGSTAIQAMDVKPAGGRTGEHKGRRNFHGRRSSSSSSVSQGDLLDDVLTKMLTVDTFNFEQLVTGILTTYERAVSQEAIERLVDVHFVPLATAKSKSKFSEDKVAKAKISFMNALRKLSA